MRSAASCLVLLLLAACAARDPAPPPPPADGGAEDGGMVQDAGPPPPTLLGIEPNSGLVTGGTPVTLTGANFDPGALVQIGGLFADDVQVESSTRITAKTPPAFGAGAANVRVANPDGQFAVLLGAFSYEEPPPVPIGGCSLVSPESKTVQPLQSFEVRGRIFSEGVTVGAGQGEGLRGQAGYGFPGTDPAGWTWLTALYDSDVDGPSAGDQALDEYRSNMAIPLEGTYRIAFRFSGDRGRTWSYCDLDGLDNGFAEAQAGQVRVQTRRVGFCKLDRPEMQDTVPGSPSDPWYGHVFVAGVTEGSGAGAGVTAELGYGPVAESPVSPAWSWVGATYAADVAGVEPLANDEYQASLTVAAAGSYDVAFRFSVDDGVNWTYCDRNGSDDGYASAQAARLTVQPASDGVDWCRFEGPAQVQVPLGTSTPSLVGRVFVDGVTPGVGPGADVSGQVGYGPPTAAVNSDSWTWVDAGYQGDVDGPVSGDLADDEYAASLTPGLPGTFAVAFRFRRAAGQAWSYCDLDGLDNGFDLGEQTGRLQVDPIAVGFCSIDRPSSSSVVAGASTTFFGRVFVAGRTPGTGAGTGIRGQVGYGQEVADPQTWTWSDATYSADVDGTVGGDLADDEYAASFPAPAAGAYRVAFRFSVDGGQTWTLCDLGPSGSTDGFDPAATATLTVSASVRGQKFE